MATQILDAKGLKCPKPTLKLTAMAVRMKPGDILDVIADCPTFEDDIRGWCDRAKKILLWVQDEGAGAKHCRIQF